MTWHLFYIEAGDVDGVHGYIVSAESESEAKAQELAEGAVLVDLGTAEQPATIESVEHVGGTDADVFKHIGLLHD